MFFSKIFLHFIISKFAARSRSFLRLASCRPNWHIRSDLDVQPKILPCRTLPWHISPRRWIWTYLGPHGFMHFMHAASETCFNLYTLSAWIWPPRTISFGPHGGWCKPAPQKLRNVMSKFKHKFQRWENHILTVLILVVPNSAWTILFLAPLQQT